MSKRPIRVTGFTRFFLVMLIVAPLAYIGASYYNGENGIEKIKQLLGLDNSNPATEIETQTPDPTVVELNQSQPSDARSLEIENNKLRDELDFKNKRNEELYRENEELKRKLESAEKVLEASKTK